MANTSVAVASGMVLSCDSLPSQSELDSSTCESLPDDIGGSTAAVLTEDMMKEEAILHKVAVAKEEETRKLNMEKMRSLAQEECYKRLTLLLEKSKHYTAHVHGRMQAQKAQLEELQQQIREQRQAKAAAEAVKKAKDAERQLDNKQSRAKCKQTSSVTAFKNLDENDNLLVPVDATLTESDHFSTNSERIFSIGDTVNVMVMPENVKTTARVLKIDCSNNTGKRYFVHYDQLIQKSNDWISEDLLVGKVATVRRSSSRSSVIASNILRQKQEAVATPSESRRGRKRKVDDNLNEQQNKRLKKDEVLVLSSESDSTCIVSSSEDGMRTSSQSTDSSAPDSSEQSDTMLANPGGDEQPLLLTGGKLRLYQLEGFKWLKMLYENGVNGILADEMGLGKTIQCIALICHLLANGVDGPFFLCAPLSTIPNWIAEFTRFAPKVPVVLYHGTRQDRTILRRDIRRRRTIDFAGIIRSFPVVVTSYEIAMNDREFLMNHVWKLLIVDEGHRIKNSNCRLIRELKMYNSVHRLLLTGTPLQNNMAELWSLLNFLIPEIFNNLGSFETWFDVAFLESTDNAHEQIVYEEQKKHTISMLHQILTPFMLRRLKSDVDFVIPPKREIVVYAPMTSKQEQFYRSVLDKTIRQLVGKPETKKESSPEKDSKGRPIRQSRNRSINLKMLLDENEEEKTDADSSDIGNNAKSKRAKRRSRELDEESDESIEKWAESVLQYHKQTEDLRIRISEEKAPLSALVNVQLRNSLALLRRCCNHPYLIEYPMKTDLEFRIDEELISSCGKLMLLDRMLTGLKQGGHKVLVFSQMTQMIDILEDYCMYRGHGFCRLDGRMKMSERQSEIDRFNNDDVFLFLLSTRAGGLGINLTQADTVVIYDSDWNPQCDLQAQDRCHRIGQNRPVIVYRLVTANTVDQKIVDRATAKRKLEKLVIHKAKSSGPLYLPRPTVRHVVDPREGVTLKRRTLPNSIPLLTPKSVVGKFKSSTDSFRTDFEPISPQELLTLLQESDYQEMLKQANDCNVITDDDLCRLLDRSELNRRWTRRLAGQTDEEEIESSNIDGVFQIVDEIWDDPVRKSPGDEPSNKS